MSIVQPIIWMGLFGYAMNIGSIFTTTSIPVPPGVDPELVSKQIMEQTFGTSSYFSYMSIGMLSFVVLFTAMFSGMSIVWDRRLGFLNKALSTPVARGSIIFAKVFSAVVRSLVQASIVLTVAFLLGLQLGPSFNALSLLGVFAALFLVCIGLSSIFILIAIRSTRWETQMAVVNLLNLPLLFGSNALFPTRLMPEWLQAFAKLNPISYVTDATRQLILFQTDLAQLTLDFAFLAGFALIFSTIGLVLSWRYLSK
jgi:ABC-2 type transport system permease protein